MPSTLDRLRLAGGQRIRQQLLGAEGLQPDKLASRSDPGWFGPGTAIWQVNGDASTLTGALSALLIQSLHPLTMAGVADHSAFWLDPIGRLNRTGMFVGATTFGSTATVEEAIAVVRAIHSRVEGVAPRRAPLRRKRPTPFGLGSLHRNRRVPEGL